MIVWDFWIKIEHNLLNNREERDAVEWNEMQTKRVETEKSGHP